MLKLKAEGLSCCERWVPRSIEAKLAHDETFRARYSAELNVIGSCSRPCIGLAALYWKYKTESFFVYRDEGFPVLAVSYERLVADPLCALEPVCAHLRIPFNQNLLRHDEFEHSELFETESRSCPSSRPMAARTSSRIPFAIPCCAIS